ncbi:MAG: hypothetical protein HQL93_11290, partial [Magnetococcales bacterium]|nr:hypothetical protein [Magnetococcales bacterium]
MKIGMFILLCALFGISLDPSLAQEGVGDQSLNARGVVLPVRQSKLSLTQSGAIMALPMEGAVVKKGELLVRINDASAKESLAKANASLAGAKLKLEQAVHAQEKNKRLHKEKILSDMALEEGNYGITQGKIAVDQSNSEVTSARLAMEGTKLFAPFDGVVTRVTAH